jgi:hypothetical protein
VPERNPNPLKDNVDPEVEEEELPPPPPNVGRAGPRRTTPSRKPTSNAGTTTIYVSQNVKARAEDLCRKNRWTYADLVLMAVAENHENLDDVLAKARVSTAPVSALFPVDPRRVKYLGGGGTQLQFTPTKEQAVVLKKLGDDIGFEHWNWLAPVLDAYLPGRKDRKDKA